MKLQQKKNTYMSYEEIEKNLTEMKWYEYLDKKDGLADDYLFALTERLLGRHIDVIVNRLKEKYLETNITKTETIITHRWKEVKDLTPGMKFANDDKHLTRLIPHGENITKINDYKDLQRKEIKIVEQKQEVIF